MATGARVVRLCGDRPELTKPSSLLLPATWSPFAVGGSPTRGPVADRSGSPMRQGNESGYDSYTASV
jgi:hypothetical protein